MDLGASGMEGFRRDMQRLAESFYAYTGLLALTQKTRLRRVFDTLIYLFDYIGLHTNVDKTVSLASQPCHWLGGHSEEAYGVWMRREGQT